MKKIIKESELPPNLVEVTEPPITPNAPNVQNAPPPINSMQNYYEGSLGPLTRDVTLVGTEYGSPRIPSVSLMPISFSGNPRFNSAVRSVAGLKAAPSSSGGNDLDLIGINYQTGNYTVQVSDFNTLISFSSATAITVTLAGASSFPLGWYCYIENRGVGVLTLQSLDEIDGVVGSIAIPQNNGLLIAFAGPTP